MARAREFSVDIALDKAIQLFWQNGYANTSMRALVKHTGVAHAGLYSEFGSKDDLFHAALLKYESRVFTHLFSQLEAPTASLKDIKKLFTFISAADKDKHFKYGCFIANTALEFGNNSGVIGDIVNRTFARQVNCFEHALSNALAKQLVNQNINTHDAACSLTVLFYGCSSLVRMQVAKDKLQNAISATLQGLDVRY